MTASRFLSTNPHFKTFLKQFLTFGNAQPEFTAVEEVKETKGLENSLTKYSSTKDQHLGFEAAAWY